MLSLLSQYEDTNKDNEVRIQSDSIICVKQLVSLYIRNPQSHNFLELKDFSLDGLVMLAEYLRRDFSNKLYMPKQMGKDQLDDLEQNGPNTFRILDGIAWDFTQAE